MLTKNAYALMFGLMNKASSVSMTSIDGTTYTSVDLTFNRYANSDYNTDAFAYVMPNKVIESIINSQGLYFGTGDTAPSVNDYKLSGEIIKNLKNDRTRISMNQDDGYTELQVTVTVQNNNENSVTIKEIGLFGYLSTSAINRPYLMDRIVLATPITIPAGGTKSITYNLRHTY